MGNSQQMKLKVSRSKENGRVGGSGSRGPIPRLNVARQLSANGGVRVPGQMIPDATTANMANLKRVKFLDPEFEAPTKQHVQGRLTDEYLKKKANLDSQLQRVIDKTRVARMTVPKKSKEEIERETKAQEDELANNPLAKLMQAGQPVKKDANAMAEEEKYADGFIRSKRNTMMRVKQQLLSQISTIEEQKTALIQKLNRALIKLDRANQAKRDLGEKLLEQVKFVRDLQKAASNGDDIGGVISTQMKEDFQREKELNFRLKDELQRCEKERLRLLSRIKLLSGEKEIEVENTDGVRRTFRVTQISIQRILDELRCSKDSMIGLEELVNQSRQVCNVAEGEIAGMEKDVDSLRHENEVLAENFRQLENKYRDTMYLNEGAKDRIGGLHRMHVKLLSTRQLEESLQKAITRNKKESIDQMLWVTRGYVNQFGAVYRLRNLILHRNQKLAKNALARWFKLACDPLMLIEQNRQIPEFFAKHHTTRLVFNREFEEWMLKQNRESLKVSQLHTIKGKIGSFWRREMKLRFMMWRDNVRARKVNLHVLAKFAAKQKYFESVRAFTKWVSFVKEQDFQVRLQGMVVSTALTQLRNNCFSGWRMQVYEKKHRREDIKKRCFRSLQIAVKKRKHLQNMALSALGFQIQADRNILKQCFAAMRLNKEEEKLIYIRDKLTMETQPAVLSLKADLVSIEQKGLLSERKRATKAFMTLFGRKIAQYFQKWKHGAITKGIKMNQNFKIRLVKLYRSKLQKAFNLWRVNRSAMIIEMQTMEFEETQSNNQKIETACRANAAKIQAADRSSKGMGARHIKKLVTQAFQRNMKAYLDRWRQKNVSCNTQASGAEKIIRKIRARYLRMAWNRYRYGVLLADQDDRNENRLCEVKVRLDFKHKKRIYNAVKEFTRKHKIARKYMKTLVNGIDKHDKQAAFRRWRDFSHCERITKFTEEQGLLMDRMNELTQVDGNTANELQKAKDQSARSATVFKTQCQKTIQKWFQRLHGQGMNYAFTTWKKTVANLRHRENLFKSIRKQMLKNSMRCAMMRWKQVGTGMVMMESAEMISQEKMQAETAGQLLNQVNDQRKKTADRSSREVTSILAETKELQKKRENTLVNLTLSNQNKFFTSKLNHIFLGWKSYMDRRRKCCQILTKALYKTATQQTFNRINTFQRETHKQKTKEKESGKMLRLWSKYRLKAAMHQWREQEYQNICMLQMTTMEESNQIKQDFEVKRENIKKHHVAVKSARMDKKTLQDWFTGWQVYASESRDCKMRTQKLKEAMRAKKIQKALRKWKMRKDATLKMRNFLKRGKFVKKQLNLKSAFQAWHIQNRHERAFANKIAAFANSVKVLNARSAFDMIKRYSEERHCQKGVDQTRSWQILKNACAGFHETKVRAAFNKWRQLRDRCNVRDRKMHIALKHMSVSNLRSYFLTWKDKAMQAGVHAQNEDEDGPTNLQAWQLRQDNFNLIKLMKDDGLTNREIGKVHQESEDKYKQGVEKSLCRLICKQTDGLSLLPKALEHWKKYAKIRKVWRRVLKDVEVRTVQSDEMAAKLWAFRRLQYTHEDRQKALWGKPIAELRNKCVKNVEKLDKLADMVEDGESKQAELIGQRNLLLKGQISGQKLAFALSVSNQQRTKMRAFSKFQEQGTLMLQGKIEQALESNLARIAALKNRIAKVENDNDELAKQNDHFRAGASEGITMVRHVEALTADRDKLSVDLADKALTIRKLLEDNQYLQNKLTNAQGQAAAIISETKKWMGGNDLYKVPQRATSPTLDAGRENNIHEINSFY